MTAAEVKDVLRLRHPALDEFGGPGPWTCIEEWMNIDLLAVCAWASWRGVPRHARIGYEVKVSRGDYKRELANPYKRAGAVAFCHEFYFATPDGLLKELEVSWEPPPGFDQSMPFDRLRCPGAFGEHCYSGTIHMGVVDRRTSEQRRDLYRVRGFASVDRSRAYSAQCPTCRGEGWIAEAPAVRAGAPKLWVPADVGLIVIAGEKSRVIKRAPRRSQKPGRAAEAALAPVLGDARLADLIRWVSYRPDVRHRARHARQNGVPGATGDAQAPLELERG